MTTSATGIWLIIAVAVAGLAVFLGSVVLAARQPRRRHGGAPAGDTLHLGVETSAAGTESGGLRQGSGSPSDR